MPLGYELFEGNRMDVTTVQEIAGTMETRHISARRVWVMDRGMARGPRAVREGAARDGTTHGFLLA